MKNIKIVNGIEYKQSKSLNRVWVSKKGTYIIPNSKAPERVRFGTKTYNKTGYPLQVEVCSTITIKNDDGKTESKRIVKNLGRLVLESWSDATEKDEVDHIDRNPFNNNIENLRWVTHAENMLNRDMSNVGKKTEK